MSEARLQETPFHIENIVTVNFNVLMNSGRTGAAFEAVARVKTVRTITKAVTVNAVYRDQN